jgi:hypothetical protein
VLEHAPAFWLSINIIKRIGCSSAWVSSDSHVMRYHDKTLGRRMQIEYGPAGLRHLAYFPTDG